MNWPDIFFRAKPSRRQVKETPPPPAVEPGEVGPEPLVGSEVPHPEAFHPLPVSKVVLPPAPVHFVSSDSDVIRDMEEADTLRQLSRSGGVRLIKRDFSLPADAPGVSMASTGEPSTDPFQAAHPAPPSAPSMTAPANDPSTPSGPETKRINFSSPRTSPAINLSGAREPAPASVYPSAMTIVRRRTKIADVARIVLPPRREEAPPASVRPTGVPAPAVPPANAVPASAESAAIVLPAAFPVAMPTRSAPRVEPALTEPEREPGQDAPAPDAEASSPVERAVAEIPAESPTDSTPDEELHTSARELPGFSAPESTAEAPIADPPKSESAPQPASSPSGEQSAAGATSLPATLPPPDTRERREFVLANGERILGHILSETPETIYVDHSTLGVLTIPRAQIAQRPVEIILVNGDRIVGDIIAETADSLFVRHASLGILTVPRNQRSTRVVEAILKDGDRILGEVLGETENFTVIRSATLGTVAVPHDRVAMLNRRAEQVEMKSLPAPSPSLENKPA